MTAADDTYAGTETILVADDDKNIRTMLFNFLSMYGYNLILAKDGQEATEKYELHRDDIHLVIMDVVMPRKDGITAYRDIKSLYPDAKIFLMTGYMSDYANDSHDLDPLLIKKPFLPMEMLKMTRAVLDDTTYTCLDN